jgi:transcriptional antiterminator NusG
MMSLETNAFHLSAVRWYAALTRSRHEKRVAAQLAVRGFESYLPQYNTIRCWSDRRVRLSLPLFPGYVFVRIPLWQRLNVLKVPSIVHLVGPKGQPTPLPEGEIENLQRLSPSSGVEPHPFLNAGCRVRVVSGPLAGMEGIVLRQQHHFRVVLSVTLILRSVCVEVEAESVQPIQCQPSTQLPVHSYQ